jgi:hypothetical protein
MAKEEGSDECCDCCKDHREAKEFIITTLGNLLDRELYELGSLMFDIGEAEFGSDEEDEGETEGEIDRAAFYDKLDGADKFLNAIRKLAKIKRYLEAQNSGELKASVKIYSYYYKNKYIYNAYYIYWTVCIIYLGLHKAVLLCSEFSLNKFGSGSGKITF